MFKVNNRNIRCEGWLKLTLKTTERRPMTSFLYISSQIWTYFTSCFCCCCWVRTSTYLLGCTKNEVFHFPFLYCSHLMLNGVQQFQKQRSIMSMLDLQYSFYVFKVYILIAVWTSYAPTFTSKLFSHLITVPQASSNF